MLFRFEVRGIEKERRKYVPGIFRTVIKKFYGDETPTILVSFQDASEYSITVYPPKGIPTDRLEPFLKIYLLENDNVTIVKT